MYDTLSLRIPLCVKKLTLGLVCSCVCVRVSVHLREDLWVHSFPGHLPSRIYLCAGGVVCCPRSLAQTQGPGSPCTCPQGLGRNDAPDSWAPVVVLSVGQALRLNIPSTGGTDRPACQVEGSPCLLHGWVLTSE